MGLKSFYLKDRVKINRYQPNYDKRVVDTSDEPSPVGDWIRARLRPVTGNEDRQDAMTKITYSYELVLAKEDESKNSVYIDEADEFEIKVLRNDAYSQEKRHLLITGAINEVRKNNRVVSYVIPVAFEEEQ